MQHNIYFIGEVTEKWLKKLMKIRLSPEVNDELNIIICSSGGNSDIALGIIDIIDFLKRDSVVRTIGTGCVHSAAADILAYGTKGERTCTKNVSIMMHEQSTFLDFAQSSRHLDYLTFEKGRQQKFIEGLAQILRQPIETLKRDVKNELWLNAEDALKYNIVDKIL